MSEVLQIGSRSFSSRLLVGTGKYKDLEETRDAITASGAIAVWTVAAVRSVQVASSVFLSRTPRGRLLPISA